MSMSKSEVMRMFNDAGVQMWDRTGRFNSVTDFDEEFVYTQDVNLRVVIEKQNNIYTPEYLPEDQQSVYDYQLTIYYNQNPIKAFEILRSDGEKKCIIITEDIYEQTLSQDNFNQMKDLNEKFTDVQLHFEQFVKRDLNMTIED